MAPVRIVVSGATGRMGRELARLAAAESDLEIAAGINRGGADADQAEDLGYRAIVPVASAAETVSRADVVIDVSAPAQLSALLEACGGAIAGRALVVGTTGLDAPLRARLDDLAAEAAVLVAANFSVGVNVLLALAERAARALPLGRYDLEVVETHHRHKADAPSGTALALGEALARARDVDLDAARRDGRSGTTGARRDEEIGFHALRGGGVAGEHTVHFLGARERLELRHVAQDRALFAEGALVAARWLAGRPAGRYGMAEVLGLEASQADQARQASQG